MIRKITLSLAFFGVAMTLNAQTILLNESFTAGIPADWTVYNEDGLTPNDAVAEFTDGWIGTIVGEDTVAASTSFYEPTGQSSDYLVTPVVSIDEFSRLIWTARSVDGSFPDGYQVLISTTDNAVASFTDTLMTVDGETPYDSERGVELDLAGYANQDIYIAFVNDTENGYILLLDDVMVLSSAFASTNNAISNTTTFNIFPNPTSDLISVTSNAVIQEVICYSLAGQELLSTTATEFSVAGFAAGTYIIAVRSENGIEKLLFTKE